MQMIAEESTRMLKRVNEVCGPARPGRAASPRGAEAPAPLAAPPAALSAGTGGRHATLAHVTSRTRLLQKSFLLGDSI